MKICNHGKYEVALDEEHFRYVIRPLRNNGTLSIANALYAVKKATHCSYSDIAKFLGLKNANQVFKVIYLSAEKEVYKHASNFLAIDVDNQCAYVYDKDHQPEIVTPPHVGPTITNNEDATREVVELVPVLITSRINIQDPYDRQLTMTIVPDGGYILGISDVNLCSPNVPYVVSGNKSALNRVLKTIHFVSTTAGKASVTITVDDRAGKTNSKVTTKVNLTVKAAKQVSVPTLTTPAKITATLGEDAKVTGVTVDDVDGKILELRITPFGCEVFGFKSLLFPVKENDMRVTGGVPATINAEIANLQVRPTKLEAYIGVQLICDKTKISKYIPVDVKLPDEEGGDDDQEDVSPTDNTTDDSQAVTPDAAEPETTEEPAADTTVPAVAIANATVSAKPGTKVDLGISFTGDESAKVNAVLACQGCAITDLGSGADITSGNKRNLIGTVAEMNAKLAPAKITVGAAEGTVSITYNEETHVITVVAGA